MITKLYIRAQQALIDFKNDQRGVTAIEYAVLAAAVATAVTAAFATGENSAFGKIFEDLVTKISSAIS